MLTIVLLGLSFGSCQKYELPHHAMAAFATDSIEDDDSDENAFIVADLVSEDPFFSGANSVQNPHCGNHNTKYQTERCAHENHAQLSFLRYKVRAFNCLSVSSLKKEQGYYLYMLCRLLI